MLAKEQPATTKVQAYPDKTERENRWVRFIVKNRVGKNAKRSLVKSQIKFSSYSTENGRWGYGQIFAGGLPQSGESRASMGNWAMNAKLKVRCHRSTTLPKDFLRCAHQWWTVEYIL